MRSTVLIGSGVPSSRLARPARTCTITSVTTRPAPSVSTCARASACCWASVGQCSTSVAAWRVVINWVVRPAINRPATSGGRRAVNVTIPSGSLRQVTERCSRW